MVWTDTLQSFSMVLGVLVVTFLGTIEAGGFQAVMKKASESNRIELFKSDYFLYALLIYVLNAVDIFL